MQQFAFAVKLVAPQLVARRGIDRLDPACSSSVR